MKAINGKVQASCLDSVLSLLDMIGSCTHPADSYQLPTSVHLLAAVCVLSGGVCLYSWGKWRGCLTVSNNIRAAARIMTLYSPCPQQNFCLANKDVIFKQDDLNAFLKPPHTCRDIILQHSNSIFNMTIFSALKNKLWLLKRRSSAFWEMCFLAESEITTLIPLLFLLDEYEAT